MSGGKIIAGLNDALAFLNGDTERGRLVTVRVPTSPLPSAITRLRGHGIEVEPSDIPGLFLVGGRELTTGQVLDVASNL